MNWSKKMIACATLVIALFTVTSTFAQGGGGRMDTAAMRQRQETMLGKMKTGLNLNQTQSDSVKAISIEFNAKRRDIFIGPPQPGLRHANRTRQTEALTDPIDR